MDINELKERLATADRQDAELWKLYRAAEAELERAVAEYQLPADPLAPFRATKKIAEQNWLRTRHLADSLRVLIKELESEKEAK